MIRESEKLNKDVIMQFIGRRGERKKEKRNQKTM